MQALEEPSMDDVKEHVTDKLSEVSTLQWPQLFGEACVNDPDSGTSRGTIVADTNLEVLSIHKNQLQTFRAGKGGPPGASQVPERRLNPKMKSY